MLWVSSQDLRAHAKLIENPLPTCGIPIAVASYSCLHVVIVDLCIQHSFYSCFVPHFGVSTLLARLDEFGEPNTEHVSGNIVFGGHCD
jgi:hypothetical protein